MAALHGLAQSKQKRRAKFREPDPLQLPPLQLGHCHVGPMRAGPTRSDSTARRPTAAEPRPDKTPRLDSSLELFLFKISTDT